jgi:hypothetical protein
MPSVTSSSVVTPSNDTLGGDGRLSSIFIKDDKSGDGRLSSFF